MTRPLTCASISRAMSSPRPSAAFTLPSCGEGRMRRISLYMRSSLRRFVAAENGLMIHKRAARSLIGIKQGRRRSGAQRQHAVGRAVAVEEGADVDDDLLAHVDAALDGGRAHMRQDDDLALRRQLDELRVHGRLVLEHVEAGAG